MALKFLMAHPWAISGDQLEVMAGLSARDIEGIDLKQFAGFTPSPTAVAFRKGQVNQQGVEMRSGVAIIQVSGVISRYAGMFENICGGTSTQSLALKIQAAIDDTACRGIVLVVDSPGGEANGIHELSEAIYAARGKKQITAYVSGSGCSAAYWIAAACDKVVMDATAQVGSIGTVQSFRFRKEKEDSPFETLELVSSQSPDKRLDPRTAEGRVKYQAALDQLSDVFIDKVAQYRGVKRQTVLDKFGQGWCLIGADAVKAGMADKLGSLESTINEITKGQSSMTINVGAISQDVTMTAGMSVADAVASLTEVAPEVVAALSTPAPLAVVGVAGFIGAQSQEVQDAIKAHFAEAPAMALDHAGDVVASLTAAGVPEMAVQFLKPGATLASATAAASLASSLKDTLAAAGMSGSLASLMAVADNPGQMVAKAIQEAQASDAQENQIESEVKGEKKQATLSYDDVYAARQAD
ncbi:MAG: S49 family peptidase [Aeromonadaceae bacterium]